jgi:hypothetical protein
VTSGLSRVTGDRYAGEWSRERFRVYGITYDLSEKPKGDIHRNVLPMLNAAVASCSICRGLQRSSVD